MTRGGIFYRPVIGRRLLSLAALSCAFFPDLAVAAGENHGGSHESGGGGLPQFDPSTFSSQIFWLTLCFVFLYVFFSRKTLPVIEAVQEKRRTHIQEMLENAEKNRRDSEVARQQYEALLEKARFDSATTLNAASEEGKATAARELQAFQSRAAARISSLEERLAHERRKILQDIDSIAAEIASKAAEKVAGINPDIAQARNVVQALNRKEAA